jgi:hypothetical protein
MDPLFVFGIDPIIATVLGLILLFIFFVYLLLRRTAQGFKDGMDSGRR